MLISNLYSYIKEDCYLLEDDCNGSDRYVFQLLHLYNTEINKERKQKIVDLLRKCNITYNKKYLHALSPISYSRLSEENVFGPNFCTSNDVECYSESQAAKEFALLYIHYKCKNYEKCREYIRKIQSRGCHIFEDSNNITDDNIKNDLKDLFTIGFARKTRPNTALTSEKGINYDFNDNFIYYFPDLLCFGRCEGSYNDILYFYGLSQNSNDCNEFIVTLCDCDSQALESEWRNLILLYDEGIFSEILEKKFKFGVDISSECICFLATCLVEFGENKYFKHYSKFFMNMLNNEQRSNIFKAIVKRGNVDLYKFLVKNFSVNFDSQEYIILAIEYDQYELFDMLKGQNFNEMINFYISLSLDHKSFNIYNKIHHLSNLNIDKFTNKVKAIGTDSRFFHLFFSLIGNEIFSYTDGYRSNILLISIDQSTPEVMELIFKKFTEIDDIQLKRKICLHRDGYKKNILHKIVKCCPFEFIQDIIAFLRGLGILGEMISQKNAQNKTPIEVLALHHFLDSEQKGIIIQSLQ